MIRAHSWLYVDMNFGSSSWRFPCLVRGTPSCRLARLQTRATADEIVGVSKPWSGNQYRLYIPAQLNSTSRGLRGTAPVQRLIWGCLDDLWGNPG